MNKVTILYLSICLAILAHSKLLLAQDVEVGRAAANKKNFIEAINIWTPLAEKGDREAQYLLGRAYARGDGTPIDFIKAFSYFEKAAEQGHRQAAYKLSLMFKFGDGVAKDKEQSNYWLRVSQGKETVIKPEVKVEPTVTPKNIIPTDTPIAQPTTSEWTVETSPTSVPTVTLPETTPTITIQPSDSDGQHSSVSSNLVPDKYEY